MSGAAHPVGRFLLDEAAREGAAAADVFLKESRSRETLLPRGLVGDAEERGVALRVFLADGRSSLAATTLPARAAGANGGKIDESDWKALVHLARRAVEAARTGGYGPLPDLPGSAAAEGRGMGILDPDIDGPEEPFLEAAGQIHTMASEISDWAAPSIRLQAVASAVHLANSSGFAGGYRQTLARMDLTLSGTREATHAATRVTRASRSLRGLAADGAAAEAISILEERISPRLPPSGIHRVLLSPSAAAEIVAALAGWLARGEEQAGLREVDDAAPRRGLRIGSPTLTLTDDGRLPGGVASAPFDGEGSRTQRTVLVDHGIVRGGLRDLRAGAAEGGSTGNGIRASFRDAPSLRPTNFFVNPGHVGPADLLASIKEGIRISTLGRIPPLRRLDTPFAVPFTGRWVHHGRLGAPLGGGYLAGNLKELLPEVAAAGSDLTFTHRRGSFGVPTLLVRRAAIRSS